MNDLGHLDMHGRDGIAKDDVQAVQWYRKAAEAGESLGMNNLGAMYESGRGGLPTSREEAVIWYRKAAAAGSEKARENLKRLGVTP